MFHVFRLMAVFIMVFSLSCGTVEKSGAAEDNQKNKPDKMLSKSAPRPEWTNWLAKKQQGDSFYFVGESTEVGSKKSAHAMAFADALAKVSISFGLTVSSTISDIRKEKDGKQSYDIGITNKLTGSPIKSSSLPLPLNIMRSGEEMEKFSMMRRHLLQFLSLK